MSQIFYKFVSENPAKFDFFLRLSWKLWHDHMVDKIYMQIVLKG